MVKPIGNLLFNLRPKDKVGRGTVAKYGPQATPPAGDPEKPAEGKKKVVKYKKRKK